MPTSLSQSSLDFIKGQTMSEHKKIILIIVFLLMVPLYQNCGEMQSRSQTLGVDSLGVGQENSEIFAQSFKCDESLDPSPSSAKRLTKTELVNTYNQLMAVYTQAEQQSLSNSLRSFFAVLPEDNALKFDSEDKSITQSHVSAYLALATAFATEVTRNNTLIRKFMGSCASTGDLGNNCLDSFLSNNATRIFRRPLTAEEKQSFISSYDSYTQNQNQWLLVQLLMSPHFLYHMELNGQNIKNDVLNISPYELASRMSYHLIQSAPDDALLAKARDGSLMDPAVRNLEALRLANEYPELMSEAVDHFYRGWLALQNVAHPVEPMSPAQQAFTGGRTLDRQSLINEIVEMTRYYHHEGNGSFDDLFTSQASFAVDRDLAAVYGVEPYQPGSGQLVSLPAQERSGLLSRAAFLVSGSIHTSPIIRGLSVRREFLCDELPPLPADIANMAREPEPDPLATTRERFHAQTSSSACAGCHALINPLGFALESFDAFGRFRSVEVILGDDGEVLNQLPVDPVVEPNVVVGDGRTSRNALEFNEIIATTGKARMCMVENFYQYAFRRPADSESDGCALSSLDAEAQGVGGLRNMFLRAPLIKEFAQRKID
jgi:hypothetical protein